MLLLPFGKHDELDSEAFARMCAFLQTCLHEYLPPAPGSSEQDAVSNEATSDSPDTPPSLLSLCQTDTS
jgi:hypothetical protein